MWQALATEFDAAKAELAASIEALEHGQSAEAQEAIQRAMERCRLVEAAINKYLEALDRST